MLLINYVYNVHFTFVSNSMYLTGSCETMFSNKLLCLQCKILSNNNKKSISTLVLGPEARWSGSILRVGWSLTKSHQHYHYIHNIDVRLTSECLQTARSTR